MTRVYIAYVFTAMFVGVLFWATREVQFALWMELRTGETATIEVTPAEVDWETFQEKETVKRRITQGLLTGQLTLDAAAEEFCRHESLWSPRIFAATPGSTDEEKCRRILIGWVELNERPGERKVSPRLKAELAEWLAIRSSGAANCEKEISR